MNTSQLFRNFLKAISDLIYHTGKAGHLGWKESSKDALNTSKEVFYISFLFSVSFLEVEPKLLLNFRITGKWDLVRDQLLARPHQVVERTLALESEDLSLCPSSAPCSLNKSLDPSEPLVSSSVNQR